MLKDSPDKQFKVMGEKMRAKVQFDIPMSNTKYEILRTLFEKNQQRTEELCYNMYKPIHYV